MAKTLKPQLPVRERLPSELFTGFKENPFEPRPETKPRGDANPSRIHLAVGRALSQWEHAEDQFSRLFSTLIRPERSSYTARRAYGAIESPRSRRTVIEAVARVYFRNFPSAELQSELSGLMKLYENAGSRRNDLAHGIAFGPPTRSHSGWYLTANLYTSKRGLRYEPPYNYTADQIECFRRDFFALQNRAHHLCDDFQKHWRRAPAKAREPY